MRARLLFFGGNGHGAARLAAARPACAARGLEIDDVPYPGFEGRTRADTLEAFLDAIAPAPADTSHVYATGIGGLIVLALRARGLLRNRPVLMQAPVLWGLEHRWMPALMRHVPIRAAAVRAFAWPAFRAVFVRRYFRRPPSDAEREAFFDGYKRCAALADLFAWLSPAFLRQLETALAADREALARVDVWWGGRDRVVTLDELRWTETALQVRWPRRVFPDWGHYPMIDSPEAWAAALADHVSGDPT